MVKAFYSIMCFPFLWRIPPAGVRIQSPYEYELTGMLHQQENEIVIKIATNMVYAHCDPISQNAVISPMGVIGPVTLWE